MKKKGGLRYSDAMYLFKTTPIITYWLPQAGIPILPNIEECVLTFTNTTYSSLHIKLPNPIIDIAGTQIKLPTMSGQYEDEYNFYTPLRWSVGDFGQVIKLKRHNFTANLEFTVVPKIVTYTIDFTNTTYPQFHVTLPEALIVPEGDSAILPSVTGTFEDEEYLYTPQEWSIGNFGDTYTPSANVTTNLIWDVQPKTVTYTLSFTNTEYPEFDLPLPEPIIAEEGSSVTLPSVTGVYEDSDYTYTPDRWDLGDFGDSVTLDENKVADLIWLVEPIQGKLPLGGIITTTTDTPLIVEWVDGLVESGGYAYPDGSVIGMPYSIGGVMYPDIQLGMFILVDASTGRVTSTLFEPQGLVFEETGHYTVESGSTLIFIRESSVETESFYFTSNGVNELNNTTLVSMNYLYTSTGEVVMQDNPLYDVYENAKPVSLMDVEGNIFEKETDDTFLFSTSNRKGMLITSTSHSSKGKQAWSVQFEKLAPSIPSIGGVLTSNSDSNWYIPYGGIIEEYDSNTLDLILGLKWDKDNNEWKTVAFNQEPSDNFWWNGLLSENDKTKVTKFGLSTALDNPQYNSFGNVGAVVWNKRYTFEVLDLYSDLGQTSVPGYDLSNLRTSYLWVNGSDILNIWSDVQDNTPVKAWKCRIKKLPSLEIVVGVRWDSGVNNWIAPSFSSPDWFYAGILDPTDITTLANFGLSVSTEPGNAGPNGNILYSDGYYYDILELYSDLGSTISSYTNMSNLTMGRQSFSLGDILSIKNVSAINSGLIMSYKLRITQKSEKSAYFTSQGSNSTSNYNIGSGAIGYQLFGPDGNHLYASEYETEDNYSPVPWKLIGIYDYSGNYVSVTNRYSLMCEKGTGYLCIMPDDWVIDYHSAYRVVYKES